MMESQSATSWLFVAASALRNNSEEAEAMRSTTDSMACICWWKWWRVWPIRRTLPPVYLGQALDETPALLLIAGGRHIVAGHRENRGSCGELWRSSTGRKRHPLHGVPSRNLILTFSA